MFTLVLLDGFLDCFSKFWLNYSRDLHFSLLVKGICGRCFLSVWGPLPSYDLIPPPPPFKMTTFCFLLCCLLSYLVNGSRQVIRTSYSQVPMLKVAIVLGSIPASSDTWNLRGVRWSNDEKVHHAWVLRKWSKDVRILLNINFLKPVFCLSLNITKHFYSI